MDAARRAGVLQGIDQNATLGQNFLVLVLLSCLIATFGLIQNSAAVIIGAMLVAPLMTRPPTTNCASIGTISST